MIQSEKSSSRHSAYIMLVTLMETWLDSEYSYYLGVATNLLDLKD